jgi:hypothetical protein
MAKVKKGLPSKRRQKAQETHHNASKSCNGLGINPLQRIASIKANSVQFSHTQTSSGSFVFTNRVTCLSDSDADELTVVSQHRKSAAANARRSSQNSRLTPSTPVQSHQQPDVSNSGPRYLPSPTKTDASPLSVLHKYRAGDVDPSSYYRAVSDSNSNGNDKDVLYTGIQLRVRQGSHTWTSEERYNCCILFRL